MVQPVSNSFTNWQWREKFQMCQINCIDCVAPDLCFLKRIIQIFALILGSIWKRTESVHRVITSPGSTVMKKKRQSRLDNTFYISSMVLPHLDSPIVLWILSLRYPLVLDWYPEKLQHISISSYFNILYISCSCSHDWKWRHVPLEKMCRTEFTVQHFILHRLSFLGVHIIFGYLYDSESEPARNFLIKEHSYLHTFCMI